MSQPDALWICPECGWADDHAEGCSYGSKDEVPYVCPGCHAVGGERCAPGCIDAEIEREHREAIESGDYDRFDEDDDDLNGANDWELEP